MVKKAQKVFVVAKAVEHMQAPGKNYNSCNYQQANYQLHLLAQVEPSLFVVYTQLQALLPQAMVCELVVVAFKKTDDQAWRVNWVLLNLLRLWG